MSAEADLARDLEEEKRRRFLPPRLLKDLVCSIDSIGLDQLGGSGQGMRNEWSVGDG